MDLRKLSKKQKIWLSLVGLYVLTVYWFIWIKTDEVSDIQNLSFYDSSIISFACERLDSGRGGYQAYIDVALASGNTFFAPLHPQVKMCSELLKKVPNPVGKKFVAYGIGSRVMQLHIDDIEIINFNSSKAYVNTIASIFIALPFLTYFLHRFYQKVWRRPDQRVRKD